MKAALVLALLAMAAPAVARDPTDWRRIASDADRARLRDWRTEWVAATASGGAAASGADRVLTDLDHALDAPAPPVGAYRCRLHRLGRRGAVAGVGAAATGAWAGAWRPCSVRPADASSEGRERLVTEGGDERPVGLLYPDTAARAVFLGTMSVGDERRALPYGRDRLRDLAGFVERVGEARWRLVLPRPNFGSTLDVVEMVPG